ncbi:MAG: hypothetical protein ACD_49C00060G0004 [uncultured bacterium (gcode 4)]|uniref:AAA+ ATPase domain-containing protein n=1 Tax=uncultured bacterium (gcode 4) TaxID=1234023 RepID=K2AWM4_9BACT|nr:MAG: hypothetical protein ACD_49C00060G0004 [uncultured bacterium (gcode 4)]
MDKINRLIKIQIINDLQKEKSKVNIIYGARQVWKTTLALEIVKELWYKTLTINADELTYNDILSSQSKIKLESLVSGYTMIFIDEAQRITNIWINLKILYDAFPKLKILVTGSSSFELANKVKESLTWRTYTYKLYPISFSELKQYYNNFELENQFLENFLVYWSYPDVLLEKNIFAKKKNLQELSNAYLYKDLLLLENLKYPEKLLKLLKLLAFQVWQEVSINELSNSLEINRETVLRYIYLLEQSFIIYRVTWFSRNLRKEISKMDKIYFWDLWIRNILIENLNSVENRNDIWALWENFLINERLKTWEYTAKYFSYYFWRIYTGGEIDYIEEYDWKLHTYEFKWWNKSAKIPKSFSETYPDSSFEVINKDNFLDFVL